MLRTLCIRLMVFAAVAASLPVLAGEVCVLRDAHFKSGASLYDPREGAGHNLTGKLAGGESGGEPAWGVSQWNTHSPFTGTPQAAANDPRFIKYSSGSKEIIFGRERTMFADVALRLDSSKEFRNGVRDPKERWPALYLWQKIEEGPSFAALKRVRFSVDAKLLFSKNLRPPANYDKKRDAAQFTVFITLQNVNKSSADFGHYVWFGIPIYDNRFERPPHHEQDDAFTKKLIYLIDQNLVTRGVVQDGNWVHFEADLAGEMKNAIHRAMDKGGLSQSSLSDIFIRSLNVGWEIPGTFDAEMQVRDLSVCIE